METASLTAVTYDAANPSTNHHNAVLFTYGSMIHRAKLYKDYIVATDNDHEVTIDFAVYKLARDVWTCVNPDDPHYGEVHGKASSCGDKETDSKIIYKLVEAANAGVKVRLLYHNPQELVAKKPFDTIGEYLRTRPSDGPWNGGGIPNSDSDDRNFRIHRANWYKGETSGQMHNKFMLASHMLDLEDDAGGPVTTNATFVATANVDSLKDDSKKKYAQSGVLVAEEPGLFAAYREYFQVVWDHTLAPEDVTREEDGGSSSLWKQYRAFMTSDERPANYASEDGTLQAFFYPVPGDEIWDVTDNAVARHVHAMESDAASGKRYMKFDMYHLKGGYFVQHLAQHLHEMSNLHLRGYYQKDSKHGTTKSTSLTFQEAHAGDYDVRYGPEGCSRKTHAKNYLLYYRNADEEPRWVTITGSTNGKDDAYNSKANNQLAVVEEKGGSKNIYQAHKDLFYGTFKNCAKSSPPVKRVRSRPHVVTAALATPL